ncbi:MAG: hypothetical protein R2854_11025 [Caldilineaceae bacterium]
MVRPDLADLRTLATEIAAALALAHRDDKLGAWIKDPQLTPIGPQAKEHLAAQKNTLSSLMRPTILMTGTTRMACAIL